MDSLNQLAPQAPSRAVVRAVAAEPTRTEARVGLLKTPAEQRALAEQQLVALPRWIIDGVSTYVRSKSELVVFLDVPRRVCALRGIARACRYFKRTRPELPSPCPDVDILPHLLRLIYRFPRAAGAQIRREAQLDPERFRIEGHPVQADALIQALLNDDAA